MLPDDINLRLAMVLQEGEQVTCKWHKDQTLSHRLQENKSPLVKDVENLGL